ncbi:hypothetical protein EV383_0006 [Pseudonocardia sediminis]|uniref:Glycoprotein n=1 Tax=Pseudonocardia sediminis TaxID=1397368 RepID=A0A4Q7URA6_PSEST|nr:DUF6049 family protein [Pseudonocardia sediminis]RZT83211.1 hypothetical protein EV383_0006 [Pseudonocardia sediminis]
MRRVAALVAIVLVGLFGTAGPALAGQPAPRAASPAVPRTATPVVTQPSQQAQPGPVRLDLATMTPRVVTGAGPGELVVTGTVTNTGPTPIESLGVRVQRGPAVLGEATLRGALDGEGGADDVTPAFADLGALAPGVSTPFRYAVPLTGDPARTLALPGPGTYPLLVNVNGSTGGERSRLATARMLLPVSGLPGAPAADPPAASPFSMLYPITDTPHRIPPVPGQVPVLTDDDLAASFGPGGRLRGLVDALAAQAPTGSPVRAATCLAIDPELVATAAAIRNGYDVATGADGATVPGRGAEAAGQWLDDLSATARGSCVLALPSSDADLVALVRGGEADLARAAVEQGRANLARDLGTAVLDGAVWPAGGVLDEPTLAALDGPSSVLLSAEGLGETDAARTAGVVPIAGAAGGTRAVITDPLLTEAATGPVGRDGTRGQNPEIPAGGTGAMSSQDLIGAMAFRSEAGPGPGPFVVAPPHRWNADGAAGAALLSAAASLIGEGRLAPTGLAAVTTTGPVTDGSTARLYYPVQAGGQEIPASAVTAVAEQDRSIAELRAAAEGRTGVGASPAEVFDPLRLGMLRAVSTAWRGRPDLADRDAELVASRIEGLRSSIRVLEPPSPYSLGTSDAPLLLTVANGLPVTMNVRIVLSSTSGLRVAPIPVQAVPPLGRVQVRVSAKVTRAGQFSVDAGLRTPDGATLGPDTRLRVRSTVYGTVTVWLTAIAGAVLVVLVVRRVLRRIRPGGGPPGDAPGGRGRPPDGPGRAGGAPRGPDQGPPTAPPPPPDGADPSARTTPIRRGPPGPAPAPRPPGPQPPRRPMAPPTGRPGPDSSRTRP